MVLCQSSLESRYSKRTPLMGQEENSIVGDIPDQCRNDLLHDHGHCVNERRLTPVKECIQNNISPYPSWQDHDPIMDESYKLLDPYFIQGYTGWAPGFSIKRIIDTGEPYSKMTHPLLAKHRVAGDRLSSLYKEPRERVLEAEEVKFYCNKHEITGNGSDVKRRFNMVPGYAGHVARAHFKHGMTGTKAAREATADFERIMERKAAMNC